MKRYQKMTSAISTVTTVTGPDGKTTSLLLFLLLFTIAAGCTRQERSDAYGQFEAVETTVSAELAGKLQKFTVEEGDMLAAQKVVGRVDTTRFALQLDELKASLEASRSKIANMEANVEVLREELQVASADLRRVEAMNKDGAATASNLDDARGRVNTLEKKITALQTEKQTVRAEIGKVRAKMSQVRDRIEDASVINPVRGTVLVTFVEPFEVVQQGQPLYRVAALDTLTLRVYVSGAQLPDVRLNERVQVLVDKNAEENSSLEGKVSWISSKAEFTPKMIQTKEERVTQVYAVKVRVPNTAGVLKIGMPAEVNFDQNGTK